MIINICVLNFSKETKCQNKSQTLTRNHESQTEFSKVIQSIRTGNLTGYSYHKTLDIKKNRPQFDDLVTYTENQQ